MGVLILYSVTLFLGSALLFLVQPMFARMVLPLLGGAPAVWNTCMVFFQVALLAGYAYAHLTSVRLATRTQVVVHGVFLLTPLLVLPIGLAASMGAPDPARPLQWLLIQLSLAVGLPFVAVSTGAPMIQRWFAATDHPASKDPYFLYAASNLGSMVGLLGYLVFVEPRWSVPEQSRLWSAGYGVYLVLVIVCAAVAFRARGATRMHEADPAKGPADSAATEAAEAGLPLARRLRWVLLAFIPSSLMLGVTTYITTDVAAVPLLWVIPLALYLLTFMAAFSRRRLVPLSFFARVIPLLVLVQLVVLARGTLPLAPAVALHLTTFVCIAMYCHTTLADDRPTVRHLTAYYLLISVGGALGGVLNALVAPLVFRSVAEYPIVLVVACAVLQRPRGRAAQPGPANGSLRAARAADLAWPFLLLTLALAVDYSANLLQSRVPAGVVTLLFGALALVCFATVERPLRFSLSLAAVIAAFALHIGGTQVLRQDRSFFGVLRVSNDAALGRHLLTHGSTLHGAQDMDPARRRNALTYFHRTGPVGQCMEMLQGDDRLRSCAIVGLGTGSLATYGRPGDRFTYYEIDPTVQRIAADPRYFTFLSDAVARGVDLRVVLGDARLTLARAPERGYGLLVLDAFSSDAIPMHLLTREAFALYLSRLSQHGLLAVHVSNRYLDLAPIVGRLAQEAGVQCLVRRDRKLPAAELREGKSPSEWLLLARDRVDFGQLARDPRWKPVSMPNQSNVWTDAHSNILEAVRWRMR